MKTDAFFVKGQSHDICQDYALATEKGIAISDGCSLINKNGICSKHKFSDVAARLICLAVLKDEYFFKGNLFEPGTIIDGISLDATISYATENMFGEMTYLRVGDGVFYFETASERLIYTVKFDPNTPEYVSYFIDEKRQEMYWANPPVIIQTKYTFGLDWVQTHLPEHKSLTRDTMDLEVPNDHDLKSVSLFSDGILDIHGPNGRLDVVDAVKALVSFKRTNGEFVLARMKSQLRDWAREGIYPNDDLSMATLILEQ